MGNQIGVDVSGTLIRVTCVCFPKNFELKEKDSQNLILFPSVSFETIVENSTNPPISIGPSENNNVSYENLIIQHRQHPVEVLHSEELIREDCPYCIITHADYSNEEISVRNYLDETPLWGTPKAFCFTLDGSTYPGKVICFVINAQDLRVAINSAIPFLCGTNRYIQVTGSGTNELRRILNEHFSNEFFYLHFHKEINCILEAVNFLACHVPNSLFRYARTHRALNSVLPDDTNYLAVPLDNEDIKHLYPFLLVNLKAGVSFHLVTAPNKSERVGGSTIGGATFMGLLRLLCPSIQSPLDAFLLAQSGDNSTTDMLVKDIYGGDYSAIGLKGTTIASTFGKVQNASSLTSLKPARHGSLKWVKALHKKKLKHGKNITLDKDFALSSPETTSEQETLRQVEDDTTSSSILNCVHNLSRNSNLSNDSVTKHIHHKQDYVNEINHGTPMIPSSDSTLLSALPYCNDPICCCCGRRRWAKCLTSEAAAAAAVGILEKKNSFVIQEDSHHELSSIYHNTSGISLSGDEIHLPLLLNHSFTENDDTKKNQRLKIDLEQLPCEATEADVARSILTMMSFNVAQLAYFNAVIHKCNRIVLVGYYLEMPGYLSSIQHCIDFWSGGDCKINFVRLATNLGALGASLRKNRKSSGANLMDYCTKEDRTAILPSRMCELDNAFECIPTCTDRIQSNIFSLGNKG